MRWFRGCAEHKQKEIGTRKECLFLFAGDPYGNRTHVTAVKGPCLNRLTNGPKMVAAIGFEPMTCRVWTGRSSQLSYAAISFSLFTLEYYIIKIGKSQYVLQSFFAFLFLRLFMTYFAIFRLIYSFLHALNEYWFVISNCIFLLTLNQIKCKISL